MSIYTFVVFMLLFFGLSYEQSFHADCSGFYEHLYKRRYNQIVHPATHNGHSYKPSDVNNQDIPLQEQLERGIRATKLHVWYDIDSSGKRVVPFVCHGIDKSLLYNPPVEKILEQVPFLLRSFARSLVDKVSLLQPLVSAAFYYAYGVDNATGRIPFRHCILDPAAEPLEKALQTVSHFLQNNQNEVITLILEDHTRNSEALYSDFENAKLLSYLHVQKQDQPWPFLQNMIDTNKRLVVFIQAEDATEYRRFPWMHYLWDYAFDTKWDFKDVGQLKNPSYDTIPHRGKDVFTKRFQEPKNKLFIVHHFLTEFIGGSKGSAIKANKKTILRDRLKRLAKKVGQLPTIVQVDFFEYPQGDFLSVINELNGEGCSR